MSIKNTRKNNETDWKPQKLISYRVSMEDGHVENVKSIDEFTARMQCSHLKLLHGIVMGAEEVK